MLKRLLSLMLAMALLFTAAVPTACSEVVTSEVAMEMIPQLQTTFNEMNSEEKALLEQELAGYGIDLDSISFLSSEPMKDAIDPSLPRNTREYTLELKPKETGKIEFSFHDLSMIDLTRRRVVIPASSSAESIATGNVTIQEKNSGLDEHVTISVQAKDQTGDAIITCTAVSEGRGASGWEGNWTFTPYEAFRYDDWVVHVTVKEELNPPKVEVRLVPGNTTKLVTGYPEWVDALDDALGLWGVGDLIDLVMAFTGVGAAAEVARDRIISWLIFDQLHAIRKPDVSPDIQLDVSVYNPNDVSLKYQVTLSSAADFSNSTTFASGGVDTYAEYMQPAATAGTGPLSTSAYASLSLAPGWTRIHHFKLKPHMLYGGGEYTVPFTMLIPWSENDPDVAFGSRGGIQEDFDIHVVSELDEEHTYQGKEVYKDLITRVKNAIEFIMKYNPVKISIQQQLPVPL